MKYQFLKLQFQTAVHFGDGGLTTCENIIPADTLFSALCCEAAKIGEGTLKMLVDYAKEGKIAITDALPFIKERYYVPKPMFRFTAHQSQDSSERKVYKKLAFLPIDQMNAFIHGKMDVGKETDFFHDNYGKFYLVQKAAITGKEEPEPYSVELFRFKEESGLYVCIAYTDEDALDNVLDLFDSLQYTGLGGKVSSGYGRFIARPVGNSEILLRRVQEDTFKRWMSLSICLPRDEELENALEDAGYLVAKRGGFIASESYADTARKKNDLYALKAGSVFVHKFKGDVYDVSEGGAHPVYRYAKPFFLGVM